MISCKRAAELISKSMDEPLTLSEELKLKVHLFICEMCEQFRVQLKTIRRGLCNLSEIQEDNKQTTNDCPPLCSEAKDRIKKRCLNESSEK